MVNVVTTWYVK